MPTSVFPHAKTLTVSAATLVAVALVFAPALRADHTPVPASVTVAGDLQSELGCPGDWQPDCAATHVAFDAEDDVWQGTFNIPAGSWQYKVALNDTWDENYGANAQEDGANISLNLAAATDVKFYYDHKSHWIADNVNSVIATVTGDFQSELGCSGDWQPWCLQSWLQDPDGDGTYAFVTVDIPAGSYQCKVAHDEAWDESYPAADVVFTVPNNGDQATFTYDPITHLLDIQVEGPPPPGPASVTVAGSLQDELGCPGDWQPDCAATHLAYDPEDDVWQGVFNLPAGAFEYKAALNDSWDENYGANAQSNGANIPLGLGAATDVKFYYDDKSNWITDNVNSVIATVAGDFQSELGCSGDWQPWCLGSWLQDPDGDGIYSFFTTEIPAGSYECKVAHDEDWGESYGQGGLPGGGNIPFTVAGSGALVTFVYDPGTHILEITVDPPTATAPTTWGSLKSRYR